MGKFPLGLRIALGEGAAAGFICSASAAFKLLIFQLVFGCRKDALLRCGVEVFRTGVLTGVFP